MTQLPTDEITGGLNNYYLVRVDHPQRDAQPPYQAECEDIIQALGLDFNEGCVFKAIWRRAMKRKGNGKHSATSLYDAEKILHYAKRIEKFEAIEEYKHAASNKQ